MRRDSLHFGGNESAIQSFAIHCGHTVLCLIADMCYSLMVVLNTSHPGPAGSSKNQYRYWYQSTYRYTG